MITREDLLKSSEYWIETIQNKIYNDLVRYIEENKIQNKEIAETLGLSKGRVSQILSGENLNYRLDTLVKLCLAINKVPDFQLTDVSQFIFRDSLSTASPVFKKTQPSITKIAQPVTYSIPKSSAYSGVGEASLTWEMVEESQTSYSKSAKVA